MYSLDDIHGLYVNLLQLIFTLPQLCNRVNKSLSRIDHLNTDYIVLMNTIELCYKASFYYVMSPRFNMCQYVTLLIYSIIELRLNINKWEFVSLRHIWVSIGYCSQATFYFDATFKSNANYSYVRYLVIILMSHCWIALRHLLYILNVLLTRNLHILLGASNSKCYCGHSNLHSSLCTLDQNQRRISIA